MTKFYLLTLFFLSSYSLAFGQQWVVKTNLLYDAATSINLGAETKLSDKWTLDVSGNVNPWSFSENRQLKHILLQPEARYWFCGIFNRDFIGVHMHGSIFNAGRLDLPGDIGAKNIQLNRYKGWLAGAGVSYGYHWILRKRWSIEATVGVGYAYIEYDRYTLCEDCIQKSGSKHRHYFGPTKLGVSLIYTIK